MIQPTSSRPEPRPAGWVEPELDEACLFCAEPWSFHDRQQRAQCAARLQFKSSETVNEWYWSEQEMPRC